MKILVFDDNPVHRKAAEAQLKDHDLTVVGTYDEAQKLLTPWIDYDRRAAILQEQFGNYSSCQFDDEGKKAYFAAMKVASEQATTYPNFDVVLTDLLVPPSTLQQGQDMPLRFPKEEMPVGIFIGLLGAVKAGAKYVAVFTDSSHHAHPASACFDAFSRHPGEEWQPAAFSVGETKFILCNNRGWVRKYDPSDLSKPLEGEAAYNRTDTVRAKNWEALLEYLLVQ